MSSTDASGSDLIILIPARMQATRLPGKPLADIHGKPMILHVLDRAREAGVGSVAVATDDEAIRAAVGQAGGRVVMTRPDHETGSDRIFEALSVLDGEGAFSIVVNLQGDLPTIEPELIRRVVAPLADPAVDIATLAVEITDEEEKTNPNVVKVVGTPLAENHLRALYFTRATAPANEGPLYHHIGIYAYRRAALERFVKLPQAPLEKREKLEQLRALENGMRIDVAIVDAVPLGVDTPADLEKARALLAVKKRQSDMADKKTIVFQGEPGANSHIACRERFPDYEPVPCATFEDAFAAVSNGEADLAMIPIENSVAGRVADIHHLMPTSGLNIVGEFFLPLSHQLMAIKGATLKTIKSVQSHVMALGQCRNVIRELGLTAVIGADTAGSARQIMEANDPARAAIASALAAEIYGLDIVRENIEDEDHNTTRFIILQKEKAWTKPNNGAVVTTFVFKVRNVPAALYKALGGFATNSINMTKLESYQIDGNFVATQFYADVEGHPDDRGLQFALEELQFFSEELRILGVYPAHPFRMKARNEAN